MRIFDRVNWSFAGFVVTSIALIVGFVSLAQTSRALDGVTQRLADLESRDEERNRRLEQLGESIETTWTLVMLSNFQDEIWPSYLYRAEGKAIDSEPRYIKSRAEKELTSEGERLLDTDLMDKIGHKIDELHQTNKPIKANHIIRELSIEYLLEKAKSKEVALHIMIVVVNSYIEKVKQSKSSVN